MSYQARVALRMLYKRVRDQDRLQRWRIVRGDKVQVMSGKDEGKQGEIKQVIRKQNAVVINGVNLVKKHVKDQADKKGGIFQKEAPVHISKVALLDPSDNLPTKTNFRFVEQAGKVVKVRISKRTNLIIPKPALLTQKRTVKDGPKDTEAERVFGKYLPSMQPEQSTNKFYDNFAMPKITELLNEYQKARPPPRKALLLAKEQAAAATKSKLAPASATS